MSATIQIRRGALAGLPTGAAGEPLHTSDQKRLYIGDGTANWLLGLLNKIDATTAPTVNDDAGDGFSVGSQWIDTTGAKSYVCLDSTVGAAVWHQTDASAAGGITQLTGDVTAGPGSGSQAATIPANTVTYAKMQDVSATSRVLGRKTAGSGDPEECSLSDVLDMIGSAAQGDILYRGASSWAKLAAGTSGRFLKTQGAGANPAWGDAASATNILRNAELVINQRGSASYAAVANNQYTYDGWKWISGGGVGAVTISASALVPPADHISNGSLLVDCTTADATIAAGDLYAICQDIEGYDFSILAQQDFSLSFWVRSTKTGTFCVAFTNSGKDRSYVAEYTVSASDTWEYKTISIPASPSAGAWDYFTGLGLRVAWTIAAGTAYQIAADTWTATTGGGYATSNQVNGLDSVLNNFLICQVMLNLGEPSTFVPVPYALDLERCQRYFLALSSQALGIAQNSSQLYNRGVILFPTTMRATPTLATTPAAAFSVNAGSAGTVALSNATAVGSGFANSAANWTANAVVSLTAGLTAEL